LRSAADIKPPAEGVPFRIGQSEQDFSLSAWVLNPQPQNVPILVAARRLKPLGNPPPNSVKFFAAAELLELVEDWTWLARHGELATVPGTMFGQPGTSIGANDLNLSESLMPDWNHSSN
jgi:hypothetical protein